MVSKELNEFDYDDYLKVFNKANDQNKYEYFVQVFNNGEIELYTFLEFIDLTKKYLNKNKTNF